MRVLIVRPAPGNTATAAAVAALGLEPVVVPLFDSVPVDWTPPDPAGFDAVVLTSASAARLGGAELARYRDLPVFAVGGATAAAARNAGFEHVVAGKGDADALAPLLPSRVLHLTGIDHRPLAGSATVTAVPVYAARPIEPAAPLDAAVALVHSPRAGARLAALVTPPHSMRIVAISDAAAAVCGAGWRSVDVAETPREHAMLACLARVCEAATH